MFHIAYLIENSYLRKTPPSNPVPFSGAFDLIGTICYRGLAP